MKAIILVFSILFSLVSIAQEDLELNIKSENVELDHIDSIYVVIPADESNPTVTCFVIHEGQVLKYLNGGSGRELFFTSSANYDELLRELEKTFEYLENGIVYYFSDDYIKEDKLGKKAFDYIYNMEFSFSKDQYGINHDFFVKGKGVATKDPFEIE